MVKFKNDCWNIQELEIQEWIEPKQKGFQKIDVETLQLILFEHIKYLRAEWCPEHPETNEEFDEGETAKTLLDDIEANIIKRFGFKLKKKP